MPVEQRNDGSLVFGYLDTGSASRAHAFDTVLVRTARQPYRADLRPHHFGVLNACDISGEQEIRVLPRPSPTARPSGHMLGLLLSGRGEMEQDGRRVPLVPGEFVLYTGVRPFRLDLDGPYRYFVVSLDSETAGLLRTVRDATANRELPQSPSGRVLAAMLTEVAQLAHRLGPLSRREMGEHVTGMIRTLVFDLNGRNLPSGRTTVLERVLDHIDRHLADDLGPSTIAAAHHISVRYLHALFRRQGDTVGDHVRRRRLDRIRRDLADPAFAHLPAYAVAARWGIREPSHFSKVFRAEFGMSPREFRKQVLGPAEPRPAHRPSTSHPARP